MCTLREFASLTKALVTCCFLSWITLAAESVVLKSLSTLSASECCNVCGQTETCQGVSYEEQTDVCEIRGSLEEIPDWVLVSRRDGAPDAVNLLRFVKDRALLTSPVCGHYLVSGEHGVTDQQLSASSSRNRTETIHGPYRGRLFSVTDDLPGGEGERAIGAWVPEVNDPNQYIQVQFNGSRIVRGIATQGRDLYDPDPDYYYRVKEYRALYSLDCVTFLPVKDNLGNDKIFPGNTDQDSVVTNTLDWPVLARCFRINPVSWKQTIALRFDVIGCLV